MKERIKKIIETNGLSNSEFAKIIGVQRSNISHVLSGRNKPSLEFAQKVLGNFKDISATWLIMGTGQMYSKPQNTLFDESVNENATENNENSEKKENSLQANNNVVEKSNTEQQNIPPAPQIVQNDTSIPNPEQIVVLFDDATFKTYKKRD